MSLRPPRVRRSAEVDEAILGTYPAGASSHRIRKALTPLLGEKHLSDTRSGDPATRHQCCTSRAMFPTRYGESVDLKLQELRRAEELVLENRALILRSWYEHLG